MAVSPGAVEHYEVVRPALGHARAGDVTVVVEIDGGLFVAIVDVLGHGMSPSHTAATALSYLKRAASADVPHVLDGLDRHLAGTEGAAVGLAFVDTEKRALRYVGVGNTVLRRIGEREARLVSRDGVVGGRMRTPLDQQLALQDGDVVLLYTDGVRTHFTLEDIPRLLDQSARTIARTVVDRFGKDYDDASCIALKVRE